MFGGIGRGCGGRCLCGGVGSGGVAGGGSYCGGFSCGTFSVVDVLVSLRDVLVGMVVVGVAGWVWVFFLFCWVEVSDIERSIG